MRGYFNGALFKGALSLFFLCTINILSVAADWRNDIGIFRVGIIKQQEVNSFRIRAEPFRLALVEALNLEVEFYTAPDATTLIDALKSERIEYAILPASSYALAWAACECVEPLVVPKSFDSTDGYHAVVISNPAGPKSLIDLASSRIGVMAKNSIVSHLFPVKLLKDEGVLSEANNASMKFFSSASDAINGLIQGEVDALIGWSSMTGNPSYGYSRGTLNEISKRLEGDLFGYDILWQSPQLPHQPHVIRRKMDGEVKTILRNTMINLYEKDPVAYDSIEPIMGGGFNVARQERFKSLIEIVDTLYVKPKPEVGNEPALATPSGVVANSETEMK